MSGFSIDAAEWRLLMAESVQRLGAFINEHAVLTREDVAMVQGHLDRQKRIAAAWFASAPMPNHAAPPIEGGTSSPDARNGGDGAPAARRKPQPPRSHAKTGQPRGRPPGRLNNKTLALMAASAKDDGVVMADETR